MVNTKKKRVLASASGLRSRAEKLLKTKVPDSRFPQVEGEALRLLNELHVHQIELEIQNAELLHARNEMEIVLEKYTDLYDFAPVSYFTFDHTGAIRAVNLTATSLIGIERSRLIGRCFDLFVVNEHRQLFSGFLKKVFDSQSKESCEVKLGTGNSSQYYVQIEAIVLGAGQECRAAVIDITERKQVEEERDKLESQLIQIKKMESVGRLAGGVAHEYNNMLGIIMGYTEIALDQSDPTSSLHQNLLKVQIAGQRTVGITRQLLSFARKQLVAPKIIDLNEIIEIEILNMLRQLIGENIDLEWKPKADLWMVKIDEPQIDQLLINLCVNARDAISGKGKITVTTDKAILDDIYCANHPGATPGEYVLLAIRDNGCGIDKEILANIFEPFFTTKEFGQGTGLGLATVYGIVKQNNGYINVDSVQGVGTTFSIYLPRYEDPIDQARKDVQAVNAASCSHATILVVEDELMTLNLATVILQTKGYTVLSATTPFEALELAEQHTGEIHLLVTDMILPVMNGRELASRLHSLYPDMKLLFMSGYTGKIIARHGVLEESCNFIEKPFSSRDFTSKIHEILEKQ